MNEEALAQFRANVIRREMLAASRVPCPNCGEFFQIQLREWLSIPAKWKCRICKHKWTFEPKQNS